MGEEEHLAGMLWVERIEDEALQDPKRRWTLPEIGRRQWPMNRIKTMEPALQSLTLAEMSATLPIIRVRRAYRWLS